MSPCFMLTDLLELIGVIVVVITLISEFLLKTACYLCSGVYEIISSLAWFVTEPRTFVAGVGNKFLKIFDMRGWYLQQITG
jgi:hypothetical protein